MRIKQCNEEVLFAEEPIVTLSQGDIQFLKERAEGNVRKRIRLCAHMDIEDRIHEMIIVHKQDTYVRPHKHLNKSESFHIIEGSVYVILFDNTGNIINAITMGDYSSGLRFYYRISNDYFHTLLIRSEFLVFHETSNGPFRRSDTVFAPWSPEENDTANREIFMKNLTKDVEKYRSADLTSGLLPGK